MKQNCFMPRVLFHYYFGMIGVKAEVRQLASGDMTTRNFVFLSNCVQPFFWRSPLALCIISEPIESRPSTIPLSKFNNSGLKSFRTTRRGHFEITYCLGYFTHAACAVLCDTLLAQSRLQTKIPQVVVLKRSFRMSGLERHSHSVA